MTGGWAATNTLREALDTEYDGFCAWCQCSVSEQPHASECEGRRATDALALVEAALDAATKVDDLTAVLPDDMDVLWTACEELHAALRAVREGK